jgi:hypothetical protein
MSVKVSLEITAEDQASAILTAALSKIDGNLEELSKTGQQVTATTNQMAKSATGLGAEFSKASDKIDAGGKKVETSTRDVVTGFSGLATAAFSLFNAYDRVADMSVQVDRANLMVKTSANAVEDAQRRYNAAVEKFGPASEQAISAAADLALAQERYQVSVERAQMMQGNFNEVIIQSALGVIPTAITAVHSFEEVTKAFQRAEEGSTLAKFANIGAMIQQKIVSMASMVAEKAATAATWLYNVALTVKNALTWVGIAAIAAAVAATALMVAMMNRQTSTTAELSDEIDTTNNRLAYFNETMRISQNESMTLTDRLSALTKEISSEQAVYEQNKNRIKEINDALDAQVDITMKLFGMTKEQATARVYAISTLDEERAALITVNQALKENIDAMKDTDVELERMHSVEAFYFQAYVKNSEAWTQSTETAARKVKAIFEDTTMSMEQKTEASSAIISQFAAQWETLGKALGMTWEDFKKWIFGSLEDITKAEDKLTDETEKTLQKHADWLENAYFDRVTSKTAEFNASLETYGKAYNFWLGVSTDMTIAIAQAFTDLWGGTLERNLALLENYNKNQESLLEQGNNELEAAKKETERIMQEHLATIDTYFFESYTAKTRDFISSQGAFAKEFKDILENQSLDIKTKLSMTESLVSQFADLWGISWESALKIIQDGVAAIEAEIGKVPLTIQEQLINRAQNNLEAFKNCASGKFFDITKDSKASWDTLVTDTNDLITAGLLGQAQDNIQAFVDCSTNKQADMVEQIDGYLTDLQSKYDENIAKINDLVAAGKTEEAAILEAENAEIMAKIQQLEDWRNMIVGAAWEQTNQIVSDAIDAQIASINRLEGRWADFYNFLAVKGVEAGERYMPEPPQYGEGPVIPALPFTPIETPALPAFPIITPAVPTPTPPILGAVTINVNVAGSADRATAELAANLVENRLKSVIVEASSSGAPATSKRIRVGTQVGP